MLDSTDSLRKALKENRERAEAITERLLENPDRSSSLHVALSARDAKNPALIGRMRILVCDDDGIRGLAFAQGLNGAIIAYVGTSAAAWHLILLDAWDVVFLDLCRSSPGDGPDLVRKIVQSPRPLAGSLIIVHSTDPCGAHMAADLRARGLKVVQRTFAWMEVPLLRRLVRERKWPRSERVSLNGFEPPLVFHLDGYTEKR